MLHRTQKVMVLAKNTRDKINRPNRKKKISAELQHFNLPYYESPAEHSDSERDETTTGKDQTHTGPRQRSEKGSEDIYVKDQASQNLDMHYVFPTGSCVLSIDTNKNQDRKEKTHTSEGTNNENCNIIQDLDVNNLITTDPWSSTNDSDDKDVEEEETDISSLKDTCSVSDNDQIIQDIDVKDEIMDLDYLPTDDEEDTCNENEDITQDLDINDCSQSKASNNSKRKIVRNKVLCLFCNTNVDNFARHLTRNHYSEMEVKTFLAMKKNSVQRKQIIGNLRKKGNYFLNVDDCVRPVRKPDVTHLADCKPCEHCLGFYSRKHLWRHKKNCTLNRNKTDGLSKNNILFPVKPDSDLVLNVFPPTLKNRASLVANKPAVLVPRKKKRLLIPWTLEQKRVVREFFKKHIKHKIPAKKSECESLKSLNEDLLANKNWLKIKVFVQNEYKKTCD